MTRKRPSAKSKPPTPAACRRATAAAKTDPAPVPERPAAAPSPEAAQRLVHDLHVHQVELKTQNEELRRAQADLEASRARYFDLYDLAPVGYITVSEAGLILEANLTATTLLGVARGALTKQPLSRFIRTEDHDLFYRHCKQLFAGGTQQACELRLLRPDGTAFWARLDATAAQAADGTRVCRVVIHDITERKQAETALRESEARHRALFEASRDALMTLGPPAWDFLSCNPATVAMFRMRDEADFTARAPWELSPETQPDGRDSAEKAGDMIETAMREGSHFFPWTHRRADGETFPAEVLLTRTEQGGHAFLQATVRDITERRRAEAQLTESKFHNQLLLDTLPCVALLLRPKTREIVALNRAASAVGAVIGKTCFGSWPKIGTPCAFCRAPEVWVSGQERHVVVEAAGVVWDAHWVPVSDDVYLHYAFDITERVRTEEALRESEARRRRSEKLEAIGQLAGGVAHDFNNQLTGVLGYADMLCERLDAPNLKRYAEIVRSAAQRAADLTANLLAFAREGQYQSVPVDVHQVIQETVEMLERGIDKRVGIELLLRAHSPMITGDPTQLQNALLNLGLNARDAMPDGGTLTFETQVAHMDAEFCARHPPALLPGDHLVLTVTDTGQGMSDEVKRHLFEPFFTTKRVGKGTGLGLAAVYGTVGNHLGAIDVSSAVGHGTTFTIYLPMAKAFTLPMAPDGVGAAPPVKLRVLVVDDEGLVRDLASEILKGNGHTVTLAADGREAVDIYRQHWQDIDLVLLDIVMPKLGGGDTFRAMRAINPGVRVIVSSGFNLDGDAQAILSDGALGFIAKPYRRQELLSLIAQVTQRQG